MTVTYAPPLTGGGDSRVLREALAEGPAYGRTRTATRWHRIRSGYHALYAYNPNELRTHYQFWCGQVGGRAPLLVDEPPTDEPRCGTCEGRYAGWTREHNWIFTPRGLNPPRLCPGSQREWVKPQPHDPENWRRAICLVCGLDVKMRAHGGWYNPGWGTQKHGPGPDLVPGCEFHGWRELTLIAGRVQCRCGGA